jgi:hypothetical protein
MSDKLENRVIHIWRGDNQDRDIESLIDSVIHAVPDIYAHQDGIAKLEANGSLSAINLAAFRNLIDRHICQVRLVRNGSGWKREYLPFDFAPVPHQGPPKWGEGPQGPTRTLGPSDKDLRAIYQALPERLPKVVE